VPIVQEYGSWHAPWPPNELQHVWLWPPHSTHWPPPLQRLNGAVQPNGAGQHAWPISPHVPPEQPLSVHVPAVPPIPSLHVFPLPTQVPVPATQQPPSWQMPPAQHVCPSPPQATHWSFCGLQTALGAVQKWLKLPMPVWQHACPTPPQVPPVPAHEPFAQTPRLTPRLAPHMLAAGMHTPATQQPPVLQV
jgi:hypothetical protein